MTIQFDREDDGRWIAEVPEMPARELYSLDAACASMKSLISGAWELRNWKGFHVDGYAYRSILVAYAKSYAESEAKSKMEELGMN